MIKINKAFTLVELIVVIVILAILATIAFLSFSSQSGSARDSVRLSDTTNIRKGLELRQAVAGVIPMPASPTVYTGGTTATGVTGVTISQGTINASVLNTLSNGIKDPSGTEYKYSTISQGGAQPLYYQLALELENPTSLKSDSLNPFSDIAFAAATETSKVAQLKGNYSLNPTLPSLFVLSGAVTSASGGIYNPSLCFVLDKSSTNTFSNKDNCIPKSAMNLKDYDSSLIGYWDMETTSGTNLKDLSGYGNDGVFSGTMIYSGSITGAIMGKGLNFNGSNNFISVADSVSLMPSAGFTMQVLVKKNGLGSSNERGIMVSKAFSYIDVCYNTYNMLFSLNASGSQTLTTGGKCPTYGDWHLYTATFDNSRSAFYDNGSLIASKNISSTTGDDTNPLIIGGYDGGGYFFNGIIDDVKIYNRAISADEVRQQAKISGF